MTYFMRQGVLHEVREWPERRHRGFLPCCGSPHACDPCARWLSAFLQDRGCPTWPAKSPLSVRHPPRMDFPPQVSWWCSSHISFPLILGTTCDSRKVNPERWPVPPKRKAIDNAWGN